MDGMSPPTKQWVWLTALVASVEPLESYFEAHELFESTHEAKPILITRKEIYGMLSILMKNIPILVSVS